MARTVMVPTVDGSAVYVASGASQAVLYAPGLRPVPVVHDRRPGAWPAPTTCGLAVTGALLMRLDHALAFGRPCRRCWP